MTTQSSGRLVALGQRAAELQDQLRQLMQIGIALSHEHDLNRLLDKILKESRRFTRAEAGTLYVREKDSLRFMCVQNDAMPSSNVTAGSGTGGLIPISRSSIAGYVAATGEVLNIPDVYAMPSDVEYTFNDSFDRRSGYRTHSMLVAPMVEPDGGVIGVLQLINAKDATGNVAFPREIEELVLSLASQAAVALENANLTRELKRAYEETIYRLARASEYRDTDTGEHIRRMSHYSCEVSRHLGFSEDQRSDLLLAAPMHDIGKLAVADAILKKPGKLSPEEFREMQRHTIYGGEILAGSDIPILMESQKIALTHHEKWDGTGYPYGLAGEAIPLVGRITAVADVFDALTSKRCYKEPMPLEEACKRMREGSGSHFDPACIEAFFKSYDEILKIRERYSA
jgi:HD-GYP domain-containing protein (c-di-GMP phosphodiesterase class II)